MTSEVFHNLLHFFRSLISQQPCSSEWHDPICFPVSSSCLQLRQFCESKFLKTRVNWTFVSELYDIFVFPMNNCHLETYKNGAPLLKWTLGSTARCKRGVSIIPSKYRPRKPGDKGWIGRARVPMPSHRDYVNRPVSKIENYEYRKVSGFENHFGLLNLIFQTDCEYSEWIKAKWVPVKKVSERRYCYRNYSVETSCLVTGLFKLLSCWKRYLLIAKKPEV